MNPELTEDIADMRKAFDMFCQKANRVRIRLDQLAEKQPVVSFTVPSKIGTIQAIVAHKHSLHVSCMTTMRRTDNVVQARFVAMWIARELTAYALAHIGNAFGGRDHKTVGFALRRIENRIDTEPGFADELDALKTECQNALRSVAVAKAS